LAERQERERNPNRYYATEYVYTATGLLSFRIKNDGLWEVRKSWSDRKRKRFEDCLNDIVFGFARVAEWKCERRRMLGRQEQKRRDWNGCAMKRRKKFVRKKNA